MTIRAYYLGCPFWSFKEWKGSLYTERAQPTSFLRQYGLVFNTVEGNTTFYSIPSEETVERWAEAVPEDFRFAFKFPREITHHRGLEDCADLTAAFLERLEPLAEQWGPFMLQLPPSFGRPRLEFLDRFLRALPAEVEVAVELRHPELFASEQTMAEVDALLAARGADRVIMDTRALRSGSAEHPGVAAARHRKPDLPIYAAALGRHPLLRFIAHPEDEVDEPWLAAWAERVGSWIAAGHQPYVMIHCPDNTHAPRLARRFHALLGEHAEVGEMPAWPGEASRGGEQLSLL